jgi:hypothetical protein
MASLTLVVMAAGIGSRYGGLKQIDPVGPSGEVVLDYSAFDALRAGFDRIVFIIRKDIEKAFRERIGRRIERAADTAYILQSLDQLPPGFGVPEGRTKPWGTAQAILACKEAVRTPFLAVNADDYYGRTAFEAMAGYLGGLPGGSEEFAMAGYRLENTLSEHGTVARGVCEATPDGYLVGIRELLKIKRFPDGIKHTENDVDIMKAEFLIPEVVGELIREKRARVRVLPTRERWFGVTYPEDRPLFRSAILELVDAGAYPRDLWGPGSGE